MRTECGWMEDKEMISVTMRKVLRIVIPALLFACLLIYMADITSAATTVGTATWTSGKVTHKYQLFDYGWGDNTVTWLEAKEFAEGNDKGHLATITSKDEQAVITKLLKDYGVSGSSYWIGLKGKRTGGSWVTGEKVTYTNLVGDKEDLDDLSLSFCVSMKPGAVGKWQWRSNGGSGAAGFITEWEEAAKNASSETAKKDSTEKRLPHQEILLHAAAVFCFLSVPVLSNTWICTGFRC